MPVAHPHPSPLYLLPPLPLPLLLLSSLRASQLVRVRGLSSRSFCVCFLRCMGVHLPPPSRLLRAALPVSCSLLVSLLISSFLVPVSLWWSVWGGWCHGVVGCGGFTLLGSSCALPSLLSSPLLSPFLHVTVSSIQCCVRVEHLLRAVLPSSFPSPLTVSCRHPTSPAPFPLSFLVPVSLWRSVFEFRC